MDRPAPTMNAATLAQATFRSRAQVQRVLDHAQDLLTDPHQTDRLAAQLCKACFYGPPRMGGAAMTTQPCMCCGTDQMYGSTNTDVLCQPCAQAHDLCKHCGADLELRADRTAWPVAG